MKRLATLAVCFLLIGLASPQPGATHAAAAATGNPPLRITVFSLDYGEATLIQAPGGLRGLIGAGSQRDSAKLRKLLKSRGITSLDVLAISTWSEGHCGGAGALLRGMPIRMFLHNPIFATNPANDALLKYVQARQKKGTLAVSQPTPGESMSLYLSPPCRMRAVSPTGPMQVQFLNDPRCSLVLEVMYDEVSVLFLGDTGPKHQSALWGQVSLKPDGHVVILGRGGSKGALLPNFPKQLSTRIAVIPTPSKTSLRPAAETLASLRKVSARTYRTDERGSITLVTDGRNVTVKSDR